MDRTKAHSVTFKSVKEESGDCSTSAPTDRRRFTVSSDLLGLKDTRTPVNEPSSDTNNSASCTQSTFSINRFFHKDAKEKTTERRKRQRRLKKLEEKQERLNRKKSLETTPGQRVFQIPKRARPVSLFIRIGSLSSDKEIIPLEYYDLKSTTDTSGEDGASQLDDSRLNIQVITNSDLFEYLKDSNRTPDNHQKDMTAADDGRGEGRNTSHQSIELIQPKRSLFNQRPRSIQLPLQSAMKKLDPLDKGRIRPRSLRFLDPRDQQQLYEAVTRKDFLKRKEQEEKEEEEIQCGLRELKLDYGSEFFEKTNSDIIIISSTDDLISISEDNKKLKEFQRSTTTPPPQLDTGNTADGEMGEQADLFSDGDMNREGGGSKPTFKLLSNFKGIPVLPREATSGESSDVSGYEADFEEKYLGRRRRRPSTVSK